MCSASSAFCACYVFPMLRLFVASGGAFRCCTRFAWSVQEKLSCTVRMVGLMAYTLTEDRGVDLPYTGAWTLVRTKDAKRQRVCIPLLGVEARVFSLASGVASYLLWASYAFYAVCTFDSVTASGFASHVLPVLRALHVLQTTWEEYGYPQQHGYPYEP